MLLSFAYELILQPYIIFVDQRIHQVMLRRFRLVNCNRLVAENSAPSRRAVSREFSAKLQKLRGMVTGWVGPWLYSFNAQNQNLHHYNMSKRQLNFRYAILNCQQNTYYLFFSQMKPYQKDGKIYSSNNLQKTFRPCVSSSEASWPFNHLPLM